ncbi:SPOR domain-containing protein [Candidatus Burkholderia verschuerenii]|uniref:SPOR domain-containing protein n=1 Tax=Candidatus Burkholderia verschuerenii TaxID=242163 RepID=UPI00067AF2FD|nr:SPOR domain-containing protein [Candidatus Burkholderia verschuerenii]
MGLFSFGKKDDSGRDAYSDSPRGARHTVRTERRTRRTERTDADAMMLDPTLPEKQRARRRLVGAIALVLAAVIVLPMVLDSRPKPVTDDISIDIPNRPAPAAKPSRAAAAAPKADAKPAATPKPAAKPQADESTESTQAQAKPATPSAPSSGAAGSRFVLQIGQFDDETAAQNWVNKLKAAGVPAYLEHRKLSDGGTKSLLRAGPFPDRASAEAALAKVRRAGLGGGARQSN